MTGQNPEILPISPLENEAGFCERRQQILSAAGTLFFQAGYEGASMADIARQAGVSKGTLYNHFTNKVDLFTAFFENMSRTRLNAMEALARDEHLDLRSALTTSAQTIIELMLEATAIGLYRILIAEAEHFPHLSDIFWHYGFARTLNNLSDWFTRKTGEGLLKIEDTELAAEQFLVMCQTRIIQRKRMKLPVEDGPEQIEQIAKLTANSFLRIYGP